MKKIYLLVGLFLLSMGVVSAQSNERKVFKPFEFKDLNGEMIRLEDYKGKVVLIDFWATWCPPCVADMPNVIKVYEKYHEDGFEIIGISLDKKQERLKQFVKRYKMPWPQYFDGKGWGSVLVKKYGVREIPTTYLLDKKGRIYAYDLYGDALDKAIAKALLE